MRGTALALVTASILSLVACGGDDSTTATGGSGTGGVGGSGGGSGTGGSSGAAGTGGIAGSGGSSGGQAGTTSRDGSAPMDARADTPTGTNDAAADRPSTIDAPGSDSGTGDATPIPDGSPPDTSSPPEGGQPDSLPPSDGSSGDAPSDARADGPAGDGAASMVLTSSAFAEGDMLPADFTCTGTNVSPPLQWTAGPSGTMSYALILTDRTPGGVLIHSIIYDIPSSVMSLPMNVEKLANPTTPAGAKQLRAYDNTTYGYMGPCPPSGTHNYEFSVRAVDVTALPGVMTTSSRTMAEPIITMHTLASGLLNVTAKK